MILYNNGNYKLIIDVLNSLKNNGYLNAMKLLLRMKNTISESTLMDIISKNKKIEK